MVLNHGPPQDDVDVLEIHPVLSEEVQALLENPRPSLGACLGDRAPGGCIVHRGYWTSNHKEPGIRVYRRRRWLHRQGIGSPVIHPIIGPDAEKHVSSHTNVHPVRRIQIEDGKLTLTDDVVGFFQKTVTPFGNGAKIDCPRKFLGRKVYIVVVED